MGCIILKSLEVQWTDENFGHIQGQVVTNRIDSVKFKTGFYWEMLELNDNFYWLK